LDFNHPCEKIYPQIQRGKYVGVNDVAGTDCDHLAFIQSELDWHSSSSHPYSSSPQQRAYNANQTRYNEANSMNQTRYNEAQSMQNQHYQSESSLSQQQYNQASNLESNSNHDPYWGCCGSSGGSDAGAAALGMMGGMAMGAAMQSNKRPTTVVENVTEPASYTPYPPYGATPGANGYYSNGTYYKPEFNGSQVVYAPSPR